MPQIFEIRTGTHGYLKNSVKIASLREIGEFNPEQVFR